MTTLHLPEKQWAKIRDFLRSDLRAYVGNELGCRCFVEAVLRVDRSGAQWRLLPDEYGNWNSITNDLLAGVITASGNVC